MATTKNTANFKWREAAMTAAAAAADCGKVFVNVSIAQRQLHAAEIVNRK